MARWIVDQGRATISLACLAFDISQTCFRYQAKLNAENEVIADWLVRLTTNQHDWGFGQCFLYLRNVKGFQWNRKRVYRIWLAHHLFDSLEDIQDFATSYLWTYNHDRPNTGIGGITPKQKLALVA